MSMGVIGKGNKYGIDENIVYSFPVYIKDGKWSIVEGLAINDFSREKMTNTEKELQGERDEALAVCKAS